MSALYIPVRKLDFRCNMQIHDIPGMLRYVLVELPKFHWFAVVTGKLSYVVFSTVNLCENGVLVWTELYGFTS